MAAASPKLIVPCPSLPGQRLARGMKFWAVGFWLCVMALASGCGVQKFRLASEQLLVTDAVDQAVARMDFSPLSDRDVYFDTKYLSSVKTSSNVNVEYVISSMRQQMMAYNLRLRDKPEEAEFIIEGRVGALGADGAESTYGVPGIAAFSAASQVMTGVPITTAAAPEFSLGRKNHQWGAAKLAAFAYERESMERVWQSGITAGNSKARESWLFGMGPFQRGDIYSKNGGQRRRLLLGTPERLMAKSKDPLDPLTAYSSAIDFRAVQANDDLDKKVTPVGDEGKVLPAGFQSEEAKSGANSPSDVAFPVVNRPAEPTAPTPAKE
ncbi:MAG: DUF6655 family protein [Pirellulales bacterium]